MIKLRLLKDKKEKMKWQVILAKERTIPIDASNINEAVKMANEEKTDKEKIVNIRLMRGQQ